MSVIDIWCPACGAVRPHAANDVLVACTGCGDVREGLGEGLAVAGLTVAEMPPVVAMADCRWCNGKRPVGHDCPAGVVGCTTRQPDETPCGCCLRCLAAMAEDFARYGMPADLDTP